ncbi:glycosyltransferase involved in cell wall biosynthesis [Streptomonospora nanhaiensis]|uniref:Glycosyltransferase involved in cell wall biosynthesis n=1 Tax=Streptomonospora nanhaiensis TaxID=1323731 RepID=A0A853BRE1_9ACTN|nr:glycosyltransferase involved in cell wall biosynthesis [Streptomonospora nanhaiensis]
MSPQRGPDPHGMHGMHQVHAVLPGGVDDLASPSGGNAYDRHVCAGLAARGRPVRRLVLSGAWPQPAPADRARLDRELAALPDGALVLADGLVVCGVPEAVVPHAARLRLVVVAHMRLADETGLPPDTAARLDAAERAVLRSAAAVVATSGWAARRLAAHHGLAADRVHVVAPGTAPAPVAEGTDGRTRLLSVAAVTPRKGHDLLVDALARVADRPWECDFAGPLDRAPEHVARLRAAIARHGLAGRVRLRGPLAGAALEDAYAAADLAVLGSRGETFGMVVAEALARGIPVLAPGLDALPDTLGRAPDGTVPGILVPAADSAALAEGLRAWLDGAALRRRLRGAALARRGMLESWEEAVARMDHVLDTVAGRPRPDAAREAAG